MIRPAKAAAKTDLCRGVFSNRWYRFGLLALNLGFGLLISLLSDHVHAADEDQQRFFREKIEPVLRNECFSCHSERAEPVQAELRLDTRKSILRGGESGPAAIPESPQKSLLIQAIRHEGGLAMPPKKPQLPESTIADFEKWVESGMPGLPEGSENQGAQTDLLEGRKHWAFQPIRKRTPPSTADATWNVSPIDAFIASKLEERQWKPSRPASRKELIRRVTFDLIGLPPSPEEVQAFIEDQRPDAYEQLVDRLLKSPLYGERWAQHWLDVVRFAETEGFEYDAHVPDAWRFRDYVIDSFNKDKPFDRFLTEQIAGDEIAPDDTECQAASIFFRLGPVRRNAGNPEIALSRNEVLTERTDVIGAAFLGMTVGCARCHNHKLEPISQKDYYRLQAYMAATDEHNISLASAEDQQQWQDKTKQTQAEIAKLRTQASKSEGADKVQLESQIETLQATLPAPLPVVPGTRNNFEKRTEIHVLRRGIWENKGEAVGARPLSVLIADGIPELSTETTNPRTHLSRWLASPDHPLTARVIVNRIWQRHFGTGIVKTPNDLGIHGDPPSHPELLDWLASTFIEGDWRLKPLHRIIVLSKTYQQSSASSNETEQEKLDPENRLLWRMSRRRLSAEEVRDAMLAVSGQINLKAGGPSIMVPVEAELVNLLYKPSQWVVAQDLAEHNRRSIYLIAKRNLRLPFLENFDAPALQTSCARRETSTHAPQALEMLNGSFSNDMAIAFAQRLERETHGDRTRIVDRAFQLALGRPPLTEERNRSLSFLEEQPLSEFALAVFNLNGFLYVP